MVYAPESSPYVPGGQEMQAEVPMLGLNEPAKHRVHVVPFDVYPFWQEHFELPGGEFEPVGQCRHTDKLESAPYVSCSHCRHAEGPSIALK